MPSLKRTIIITQEVTSKVFIPAMPYVILPPALSDDAVRDIVAWHKRNCAPPHPPGLQYNLSHHQVAEEQATVFQQVYSAWLWEYIKEIASITQSISVQLVKDRTLEGAKELTAYLDANSTVDDKFAFNSPYQGYILGGNGLWPQISIAPYSTDANIDLSHTQASLHTPLHCVMAIDKRVDPPFISGLLEDVVSRCLAQLPGYRSIAAAQFSRF